MFKIFLNTWRPRYLIQDNCMKIVCDIQERLETILRHQSLTNLSHLKKSCIPSFGVTLHNNKAELGKDGVTLNGGIESSISYIIITLRTDMSMFFFDVVHILTHGDIVIVI